MPSANKKTPKPSNKGPAQESGTPTPKPSWPVLEPLAPREDLSLRALLPDQVIIISNFWTTTLCKTYVRFLGTLPLVTTPGTPKKGDAVRVNDRFQIDDPQFAEMLWNATGLRDLVLGYDGAGDQAQRDLWGGEVVGLNPNIRIVSLQKGACMLCCGA